METLRRDDPKFAMPDLLHHLHALYWKRKYSECLELCEAVYQWNQQTAKPAKVAELVETAAACCKRLELPGQALEWLGREHSEESGELKFSLVFSSAQHHRAVFNSRLALRGFCGYLRNRLVDYSAWKEIALLFRDCAESEVYDPETKTMFCSLGCKSRQIAWTLYHRTESSSSPRVVNASELTAIAHDIEERDYNTFIRSLPSEYDETSSFAWKETWDDYLCPVFDATDILFVKSQLSDPKLSLKESQAPCDAE